MARSGGIIADVRGSAMAMAGPVVNGGRMPHVEAQRSGPHLCVLRVGSKGVGNSVRIACVRGRWARGRGVAWRMTVGFGTIAI